MDLEPTPEPAHFRMVRHRRLVGSTVETADMTKVGVHISLELPVTLPPFPGVDSRTHEPSGSFSWGSN